MAMAFQSIDTNIMPCALANIATFHTVCMETDQRQYLSCRGILFRSIDAFIINGDSPISTVMQPKNRKHAPTDGAWAVL